MFGAHLKGQVLDILLHRRVIPGAANEPLGIKHGVLGVGCELVLGGIPDQALSLRRERHVGRRDAVPLVVGDDFHTAVLEDSHAEGAVAEQSGDTGACTPPTVRFSLSPTPGLTAHSPSPSGGLAHTIGPQAQLSPPRHSTGPASPVGPRAQLPPTIAP